MTCVRLLSITASPCPVLPSFLPLLRVRCLCSHVSSFFSLGGCPRPSHLLKKGSRRSTYYPVASLFPGTCQGIYLHAHDLFLPLLSSAQLRKTPEALWVLSMISPFNLISQIRPKVAFAFITTLKPILPSWSLTSPCIFCVTFFSHSTYHSRYLISEHL